MTATKYTQISLVNAIVANYRQAVVGVEESEEYLADLSKNISADTTKQWHGQMVKANRAREKGDYSAMDIYDVQLASRTHLLHLPLFLVSPPSSADMCPKTIATD